MLSKAESLSLNPTCKRFSRKLLEYLEEDLGFGDLTTELLVPLELQARAWVKAKEDGVIAGLEEASLLFESQGVKVVKSLLDGNVVKTGDTVMVLEGPAQAILSIERTALNIMMRMSGIATATRRMVEKLRGARLSTRVAATRKTAPGLRVLDKKAVIIGGGDPHRIRLDDAVLIKDNHLAILGSVSKAVTLARQRVSFTKMIEVEAQTKEEAAEAAEAKADIVMLDNMNPSQVEMTLRHLTERNVRKDVVVEVSGGVTLNNILEYAGLGIDVISVGALTHSSKALDLSLDLEPLEEGRTRVREL